MRLGVLDVGSTTVHLLVVDAHRGAHPTAKNSEKSVLRLAEHIDPLGHLTDDGADRLVSTVSAAASSAAALECDDLMGFVTSAVREASNAIEVLNRVRDETGVQLEVLSGEDEARLTFLAARRWYGWSAGRLLMLDIGGGSLEIAGGIDEEPDIAVSLPLGAGRLTREWLTRDPPGRKELDTLAEHVDDVMSRPARRVRKAGTPDRVVATSKTFRSLARLTGAAPSSEGPRVHRILTATGLRQVIAFISRMSAADLAELEGVGAGRAHQLVAGAVVADTALRQLSVSEVQICPWALREGVILRRLDWLDGFDRMADRTTQPARRPPRSTGRTALRGAR